MISDDEKAKILAYEELVSQVTKLRSPKPQKHWWESPGMISSITAIATVALTSIFAYVTQSRLRDKDFATQQSKTAYEGEVAALQRAHLLATESLHWAGERDRIVIGDYARLPQRDRAPIIDSVNASDFKWRQGRAGNKIDIQLSFGSNPEVVSEWDSVVTQLNAYANCTVSDHVSGACDSLRSTAANAIDLFRTLGVANIRKRWLGKAMY